MTASPPGAGESVYTADDALRDLASYVSAGGHNAEAVDPAVFLEKVRWGINHLIEHTDADARRYRRLRSIGAAPGGTIHLDDGLVMVASNLDNWLDDYEKRGIKPAPSHAVEYGERYNAK